MSPRDDTRSARQIARGAQRKAGDRSARLASALMKLGAPAIKKLAIDADLRDAIERARAVTSHVARRRAERSLAGELRRFDLADIDRQLATQRETSGADVHQLHLAEQWRARLIEEGAASLAGFPVAGAAADEVWLRLVAAAQRERATGRPPGAARALFRHIIEALKGAARPAGDDDPTP